MALTEKGNAGSGFYNIPPSTAGGSRVPRRPESGRPNTSAPQQLSPCPPYTSHLFSLPHPTPSTGWGAGCLGLHCVPPQIHMLMS